MSIRAKLVAGVAVVSCALVGVTVNRAIAADDEAPQQAPTYETLPANVPMLGPDGEVTGYFPKECLVLDPNLPEQEDCPEFLGTPFDSYTERSIGTDGVIRERETKADGTVEEHVYRP